MFFNQDALFYPGPAAISRRFNYPVIFQKTIKKGRGKYETSFEVLFENPKNYSEAQIMKAYIIKWKKPSGNNRRITFGRIKDGNTNDRKGFL
jgi:Kdo2-lipid IVA lauroyltransferase/acyltransferase